jgi:ribosomal protein S12 methylthiotransferase
MKGISSSGSPKSYYFFNLGCPKNIVDAERVAARLEAHGWQEAATAEESVLLVVTTCAFISMAEEESVDTILQVVSSKKPWQKVAVLGCLVTREGGELRRLIPEVDIFLDVGEMESLPERIGATLRDRTCEAVNLPGMRKLFTPSHIAYLKVAEGCSNRCSYCLIPSIRGDLRSREATDILREAGELADAGVRELVVVAQDTTAWGRDLVSSTGTASSAGGPELYDLLLELAPKGPPWIRLMYLHPAHIDCGRLVELLKGGAVLPYLDIPIQHAADKVLERMGRGYGLDDLMKLFGSLRSISDGIVLRTTVMVGFPGENEEDFRILLRFLEEVSFDHVGVFDYSPERGTRAARMDGRVSRGTIARRRDELMELQMDISQARLDSRIGGRETILVDGPLSREESPGEGIWGIGRFYGQAYEIDGVTYLSGRQREQGVFVTARIAAAGAYDLFAGVQ